MRSTVDAVAPHDSRRLAALAISGTPPRPGHLEEKREAIRRVRDCKDIVRGFDDELDLSWWKDAFKVLKPPFAEDDGGDGDD